MNKKVLIIINNLGIGGAERMVVDDINEMLRTGVDVSLITLTPEPIKSFVTGLHLKQDRFQCISFKHFFDIFSWFKLVLSIRVLKPDLVVTHLWFANTIGRITSKIAGARNVIAFEQNVYDTVKTRKMFFVDWCLQFLSTKIIAVSKAVKKSLVRHSIREARIDVIYNSVDLSIFKTTSISSQIRKEYDIPANAFLFLYIGRLIHQKAVDILIKAFKEVDTKAYLLIVGQGEDRGILEQEVKRNGLEKRVIFAGVRNDIPGLFLSSDCFVLPSRYEGLPLVLIEALAAGIAIIVSDFEAAQEVITHKENGLIVPREDVEALAQAMIQISEDNTLRENLAMEAKKSAKRFSIINHAHAIMCYVNV